MIYKYIIRKSGVELDCMIFGLLRGDYEASVVAGYLNSRHLNGAANMGLKDTNGLEYPVKAEDIVSIPYHVKVAI